MDLFRIHGDNIVECERVMDLIIKETNPIEKKVFLSSPSTIVFEINFNYKNKDINWRLELLPGFNKSNNKRWKSNIFNTLFQNGSFLKETPDVIISKVTS